VWIGVELLEDKNVNMRVSQSNETWLDNPWNGSAPHSKRRHSNLSLDSDGHELAVSPSALGLVFGIFALVVALLAGCWLPLKKKAETHKS